MKTEIHAALRNLGTSQPIVAYDYIAHASLQDCKDLSHHLGARLIALRDLCEDERGTIGECVTLMVDVGVGLCDAIKEQVAA